MDVVYIDPNVSKLGMQENSTTRIFRLCPPEQPSSPTIYSFSFILNGPFTTTLAITGFLLNIVCIIVFGRIRNISRVQDYLIALAIWDNLLLLGAFLLYSLPTLLYGRMPWIGPYVYVYLYSYFLSNIALTGTVWMMVALLIDRYRCVLHPLANRIRDPFHNARRYTRLAICLVSVLSVSIGTPYYFELEIGSCRTAGNEAEPMIMATALRFNRNYQIFFRIVGGFLIHSAFPILLIMCLLTRISLELYQAAQWRKASAPNAHRRRSFSSKNYNTMLYCVIFKFLATRLLPLATEIAEVCLGRERFSSMTMLVDISNMCVASNAASNGLIYFLVGRRFRKAAKGLFQKKPTPEDVKISMEFATLNLKAN